MCSFVKIAFVLKTSLAQSKQTTNFVKKSRFFVPELVAESREQDQFDKMQNADLGFKIRRSNENILFAKIIP